MYPNYYNKRILIVEDNEPNYLMMEEILNVTNAKILWSQNGRDAINVCEKYAESIDLILMDLKMPVLDGVESVKIIKKRWPTIPVVAQTAFHTSEDKEYIYSSGFNSYITKPIKSDNLYNVIDKFLTIK